jgi:hypothetical protein
MIMNALFLMSKADIQKTINNVFKTYKELFKDGEEGSNLRAFALINTQVWNEFGEWSDIRVKECYEDMGANMTWENIVVRMVEDDRGYQLNPKDRNIIASGDVKEIGKVLIASIKRQIESKKHELMMALRSLETLEGAL